jgi:hypothetical protein
MGDFSPYLPRSPNLRRQGFVLCFKEPAAESVAKALRRAPTNASRSTTPDSRHDRRPDVPFALSGGIIVRRDLARIIHGRQKSPSD